VTDAFIICKTMASRQIDSWVSLVKAGQELVYIVVSLRLRNTVNIFFKSKHQIDLDQP